jgi:endonuclease YncB( thermonuclease family)
MPNPPSACLQPRIFNDELAKLISQRRNLPYDKVLQIIKKENKQPRDLTESSYENLGVQNVENDKLSTDDTKAGFKDNLPDEVKTKDADLWSTSKSEAFLFRLQAQRYRDRWHKKENDILPEVADEMYKIFYGNAPLFSDNVTAPEQIKDTDITIVNLCDSSKTEEEKNNCNKRTLDKYCHDGDTCKSKEKSPNSCRDFTSNTREAYIDTPERGYFYWKDKKVRALAEDYILRYFKDPNDPKIKDFEPPFMWHINSKLLKDCSRIVRKMVPSYKTLNDDEILNALFLVSKWQDYHGWLATVVSNGLVEHLYQNGAQFQRGRTIILFASNPPPEASPEEALCEKKPMPYCDTPMPLCGMYQDSDIFNRSLTLFGITPKTKDKNPIVDYFDTRLKADLALIKTRFDKESRINKDNPPSYEDYHNWIFDYAAKFYSSENLDLRKLADTLAPENLLPPDQFYSEEKFSKMMSVTADFMVKHPKYIFKTTMYKFLAGWGRYTGRYLSEDEHNGENYKDYEEAEKLARDNNIGIWGNDPTTRALDEVMDESYKTENCRKIGKK